MATATGYFKQLIDVTQYSNADLNTLYEKARMHYQDPLIPRWAGELIYHNVIDPIQKKLNRISMRKRSWEEAALSEDSDDDEEDGDGAPDRAPGASDHAPGGAPDRAPGQPPNNKKRKLNQV